MTPDQEMKKSLEKTLVADLADKKQDSELISKKTPNLVELKADRILFDAIMDSGKACTYFEYIELHGSVRETIIMSAISGVSEKESEVLVYLNKHLELNRQLLNPLHMQDKIYYELLVDSLDPSIVDLTGEDLGWNDKIKQMQKTLEKLKEKTIPRHINSLEEMQDILEHRSYIDYLEKMIKAELSIHAVLGPLISNWMLNKGNENGDSYQEIKIQSERLNVPLKKCPDYIAWNEYGDLERPRVKYCRRIQKFKYFNKTHSSNVIRMLKIVIRNVINNRKLSELSEDELFVIERINLYIDNYLFGLLEEYALARNYPKGKTPSEKEQARFEDNEHLIKEFASRISLLKMQDKLIPFKLCFGTENAAKLKIDKSDLNKFKIDQDRIDKVNEMVSYIIATITVKPEESDRGDSKMTVEGESERSNPAKVIHALENLPPSTEANVNDYQNPLTFSTTLSNALSQKNISPDTINASAKPGSTNITTQ